MTKIYYWNFSSLIGEITLIENENGLTHVSYSPFTGSGQQELTPLLNQAQKEIETYLQGTRQDFDLPLKPEGTTFEKRVWEALLQIPYGETRTYSEIATKIGSPRAARAVGAACRRNPIALIIPCHRVIGCSGGLTGYAGGIDKKAFLLQLEQSAGKKRIL